MDTKELSGELYSTLIKGGAANLRANAQIVNDLNVFPIPDGDTGENMSLTITGGVTAAENAGSYSLSDMSDTIANGMLLSARGNSGVILSQFFSGIAKGFTGSEKADVRTVGFAFKSGVRRAYEAVMKPTEGTMLTVAREATEYACDRITDNSTMESFFSDVLDEMNRSLERTPQLLDVLREAGVIDSGGAGLVYIIDGMNKTLQGEHISDASLSFGAKAVDTSKFTADSVMEFGYCTEFLLQLQNCKVDVENFTIDPILEFLNSIGNSIVAFKTGSIVKVHVHTMTPGKVFDFCQQFGEFLTLKCENMTLQHNDTLAKEEKRGENAPVRSEHKKFAAITVATGDGIKETLKTLGADFVLDGGQGKNPSSEDFIEAFDNVNADTIFVLPNNGNIVMAAQLAADIYKDSKVVVIPSKSIGDGYAALSMLSYDSGDVDTITNEMKEAMDGVVTGEVTRSVRDANIDGVEIRNNDFIGFSGKNMLASNADKLEATTEMLNKLNAASHEVMIAIYGNTATTEERKEFRRIAGEKFPHTELYEIDGGQDVYDFEIILE
ncbi:MAG: DAK2 domain-containing protein [Lachnospiraceae bacterium]|nr:DAK2 domain-containing protein [Lachnospiraceae bacterium]